jgi:hypothetical protein
MQALFSLINFVVESKAIKHFQNMPQSLCVCVFSCQREVFVLAWGMLWLESKDLRLLHVPGINPKVFSLPQHKHWQFISHAELFTLSIQPVLVRFILILLLLYYVVLYRCETWISSLGRTKINILTPELNPSAQRCLPRIFTADFNI